MPSPSLVGHAPAKTHYPVVVGDHHPALARGGLLVAIEREYRPVRKRAVPGLGALITEPPGDLEEPLHTTGRRGFMIFRRRAWLSSLRGQLRGYREASFAILLVFRFTMVGL